MGAHPAAQRRPPRGVYHRDCTIGIIPISRNVGGRTMRPLRPCIYGMSEPDGS